MSAKRSLPPEAPGPDWENPERLRLLLRLRPFSRWYRARVDRFIELEDFRRGRTNQQIVALKASHAHLRSDLNVLLQQMKDWWDVARSERDFVTADKLRDAAAKAGYRFINAPNGHSYFEKIT